jgi:thioredoxin 1
MRPMDRLRRGGSGRLVETSMASEKVKTFTDSNFDDETRQGVVLVDLWAEWCGPCRRLAPTVDALAQEFDGRATVAKLDVDENPNVPGRYAVRGIPTLLLFKDGQLVEQLVGLKAKEEIADAIQRQL